MWKLIVTYRQLQLIVDIASAFNMESRLARQPLTIVKNAALVARVASSVEHQHRSREEGHSLTSGGAPFLICHCETSISDAISLSGYRGCWPCVYRTHIVRL